MMIKDENYDRYLIVGLVLSVLILVGISFYFIFENNRMETASATFYGKQMSLGREIYSEQCSTCHGFQGEGGVGPALNNKILLKNTLDDVLFSVIRSGVPSTQMPAWSVDFGGPLTDEDIRSVVAFVRAWEPTAPEIQPEEFVPSAERGAMLFTSTCETCHGTNGLGGDGTVAINVSSRLSSLDNDWYRGVIRNGRPASGMPTWGTVLSPHQVEDLIALIDAWRNGKQVVAAFNVTDLIDSSIYALNENDPDSATMHISRALDITDGVAAELLKIADDFLLSGDSAGALLTLENLKDQWPIGDPELGAETFANTCKPCHGGDGEGGGGGVFPQLHPNDFIQSQTNADLVTFIQDGRSGTAMAGFRTRLTADEIANVVAFLRQWQP
jgi:mono/diheme cytochrome c family protein